MELNLVNIPEPPKRKIVINKPLVFTEFDSGIVKKNNVARLPKVVSRPDQFAKDPPRLQAMSEFDSCNKRSFAGIQKITVASPKGKALMRVHSFKPVPTKTIASLFKHNPDIPRIRLKKVSKKSEPLFSKENFDTLTLHDHLVSGLSARLGATVLTAVQKSSIPPILEGKDILIKSSTGSGKTLAYAIPIVQKLQEIRPKVKRSDGIYALVVLPTRELAIQSYECFVSLTNAFSWIVPGCLIGGEKKKSEKGRIRKGINILVCTPGRLNDHLEHTVNLDLKKIKFLVIDEADRLMELGFEESISVVVQRVQDMASSKCQTVLVSATLSKGVEKMAGLALEDPTVVDIALTDGEMVPKREESSKFSTPDSLTQHFWFVPIKLRLVVLSAFLVDQISLGKFKAIVFMTSQDVVDFHFDIFNAVLKEALSVSQLDIVFHRLHGNMKQQDRLQTFKEFKDSESGLLLCTDVAARGLDLPKVDWIIQYSAPSNVEDYIHRIGRTARIGTRGKSLLFLLPSEREFITLTQEHNIKLELLQTEDFLSAIKLLLPSLMQQERRQVPNSDEEFATALQDMYESYVLWSEQALQKARKAYAGYVRAYSSYPKNMKDILPFKFLHLGHLAKCFCLQEAPSDIVSKIHGLNNTQRVSASAGHSGSRKFQKTERTRTFAKRRQIVSEFDSGLPKKKRIKETV